MFARTAKWVTVAGVVIAHLGWLAGAAHAYTIVDWMRTWPRYQAPAAYAVPAVAGAPQLPLPPVCVSPGAPVVTVPPAVSAAPCCPAPAAPCSPAPAFAAPCSPPAVSADACCPPAVSVDPCGPPACAPVYAGYAPAPRFWSRWLRVPTTNYRPLTSWDPRTGCPFTWMQPCRTFSWQVQRLPTTCCDYPAARPSLFSGGWLFPGWHTYPSVGVAAPSSCQSCAPGPIVSAPTMVPAPSAAVMPGAAAPAPSAAPYYPSYPTSPAAPSGSAAPSTLGAPVTPNGTQPLSPTPAQPADQRPTLGPTEVPGSTGTSPGTSLRNYPPLTPIPAAPPAVDTGLRNVVPSGAREVQPVPDPEAPGLRRLVPTAPSLLDPRDKSASRTAPAWRYAPIAWPEKGAAVAARPAVVATPAAQSQVPAAAKTESPLDTSGWRAVRP